MGKTKITIELDDELLIKVRYKLVDLKAKGVKATLRHYIEQATKEKLAREAPE